MRHIDPELLALLALGENAGDARDRDHLAACKSCRDELENLAHAAEVGRSTLGAGDLLEPHPRVWSAITDEVTRLEGAVEPTLAPVTSLPQRRAWVLPVAAAAAGVIVLGLGVGGVWSALQPTPATVLASASLDAFPDWAGASGEAVVQETAEGTRVIDVSLALPGTGEGYREVWLINSETLQLVSLGIVEGESGTFTIPAGLDLSSYNLVDISKEPFDGDPTHSGDSIVRGQLSDA